MVTRVKNASQVVTTDLQYICNNLNLEFKRLSGKNLLITGGAGFLGYYLIQSVLYWNKNSGEKPIDLTIYDNFIRGLPDWLIKIENSSHLHLVKHDVVNPLPESEKPYHYIIHAASIASPTYYRRYPIETMDANVNGLRYLLDYAKSSKSTTNPVLGFLFYSTSEIYGDPDSINIPTPETYRGNVSCTGPRACYDESKRYGETLCVNFARVHDIPVTIARPFNNYGPGLKITDKRVIPDIVRDIVNNRDIVLYSDGTPSRTFCYITDAIIGYYKILLRGKQRESYNIGVAEPEITMQMLAEKLQQIAKENGGYNGSIIYKPSSDKEYLTDNPNRRCPDISKAKNDLDYNPRVSLDEGLTRSYVWYTENSIQTEE